MKNRRWTHLGSVPGLPQGSAYATDAGLRAIRSREFGRWHLSVSLPDRYPTWDELADARYDLTPHDIDMAMILPPPADYVNQHPFVLQMTEVRDAGLVADRGVGHVRTRETMNGAPGAESGRTRYSGVVPA